MAACLAAVWAAPARAEWSAPQRPSPVGGSPSVAFDGQGIALAVWRVQQTKSGEIVGGRIEAAAGSVGGGFGGPHVLATTTGAAPEDPELALSPPGDATVVWLAGDAVQAAIRPAGGIFGGAIGLGSGRLPHLATDAQGNAVATWGDPATGDVRWAARGAGSVFSDAGTLSSGTMQLDGRIRVAMDPAGAAIAAWASDEGILVADKPAGGAFGAPVPVSSEGAEPQVALSANGDAVVVWQDTLAGGGLQAAVRPAGGTFGAPERLTEGPALGTAVAIDASGNAVTTWVFEQEELGGKNRVEVATRPAGGGFGPTRVISSPGDEPKAAAPKVASNSRGDVAVVWWAAGADEDRGPWIEASIKPAGGDFAAPDRLSSSCDATSNADSVAVDEQGNIVAGWHGKGTRGRPGGVFVALRPAGSSAGSGATDECNPDAGARRGRRPQPCATVEPTNESVRQLVRVGLPILFTAQSACAIDARLVLNARTARRQRLSRMVAHAHGSLRKGRTRVGLLRLSRKAERRLRRERSLALELRVITTDKRGRKATVRHPLRFSRKARS
jgi:hypothetical protein